MSSIRTDSQARVRMGADPGVRQQCSESVPSGFAYDGQHPARSIQQVQPNRWLVEASGANGGTEGMAKRKAGSVRWECIEPGGSWHLSLNAQSNASNLMLASERKKNDDHRTTFSGNNGAGLPLAGAANRYAMDTGAHDRERLAPLRLAGL